MEQWVGVFFIFSHHSNIPVFLFFDSLRSLRFILDGRGKSLKFLDI
jgi:hypothetical protein